MTSTIYNLTFELVHNCDNCAFDNEACSVKILLMMHFYYIFEWRHSDIETLKLIFLALLLQILLKVLYLTQHFVYCQNIINLLC